MLLPIVHRWFLLVLAVVPATLPAAPAAPAAPPAAELASLRSALIPKREVAADAFLKAHPTWDGRGVTIAIFDTGVDPAAAGLAVTTTGERKIADIVDASGSGDVDTSTRRKPAADGTLKGLTGRTLTLPADVKNPAGDFRLGLKPAAELFYGDVLKRITNHRAAERAATASRRQAARARDAEAAALKAAKAKAADDRNRAERDLVARHAALAALEDGKAATDAGAVYDCVVWHDGSDWRVVVDTDEDGDLRDEKTLRPFGAAGEHASFGDLTHATFGVQIYEGGDLLSVVTVGGTHGTHVAAIATGHFPDDRGRDGIAPGARIVSIKIGDIRTGGSSYGTSELRALATAARHRVDLVNASWGGRSLYQDGKNSNSRIYDLLVERYDILAVLSAGNNGPALGTAGSAGGEASRVLGVGAWLSPEMSRVLYNTLERSPETALQFTSRGPTKDGDFGVDVMAPGAAYASLSAEAQRGADMFNGTSMAAPSASGVAALVLSAAKQGKLEASPARLRAALIGGARELPHEDPVTGGAGLVNAPGAWARLQALQGVAAFGAFYDLEVDGGTFTPKGRGLQLRERLDEPRRRIGVRVVPAWAESVPPAARFEFGHDLVLKPTVPWITAPDYLHLANGPRNLSLIVDAPPVPAGALGSLHVARVDAHLAGRPELGPVFSIPVTLIQPAPRTAFVDHRLETAVALKPSETKRVFVEAPLGADRLRVWVQHRAKDKLPRRFVVHSLCYAAQTGIAAFESDQNLTLEPGEERTFDVAVKPGAVTEVSFSLSFSAVGEAALAARLEWHGVGAGTAPIVIEPSAPWGTAELNPFADREAKVEARIDRAVHVFLPEKTVALTFDERGELPASALTPGPVRLPLLRQRFTFELKEPVTAKVLLPEDYSLSEAVGGGRVTVVHESGEKVFDSTGTGLRGTGTRGSVKLPKGKFTAVREFTGTAADLLATTATVPLRFAEPLKTARGLPVRASLRDRFEGKDVTELKLRGGREEIVFLQDKAIDELAKHEPKPAYFSGELVLKDQEARELAKQPIVYLAGLSPAKTINVEPKAKPAKDERGEVEKIADTLFDSRLAFVRDQRGATDTAVRARRAEVLEALRAERPADGAPVFEQALDAALAAGLAGDFWPKAKPAGGDDAKKQEEDAPAAGETPTADPAPVFALLDAARKLAAPEAVAQYFGAPPAAVPGDLTARPAAEREKKRMTAQRELLARIERLRADVLRATQQSDAAWTAFAEIKRWEPEPDKQTRALEAALCEQAGLLGLALDALNARLKADPLDRKLRRQRAALYEKLGWVDFAANERLRLALQAQQKKVADAL